MQGPRRSLISLSFSLLLCSLAASAGANNVATSTSDPSVSPFPVPAGLEASVEFWKRVFSEFSLSQLIYFDPRDPSKIYEVTDVGEQSRSNEYIDAERARIAAA